MKNYNCDVDYPSIVKKISKEAYQLLSDLLDKKADKRPTATQALAYKWFTCQLPSNDL